MRCIHELVVALETHTWSIHRHRLKRATQFNIFKQTSGTKDY